MSAVLLLCGDLSLAYFDPVDLDVYRFKAVENYCLVAQGEAVIISDLNGDGKNDVVITTGAKDTLPHEPDYEYNLFIYFQNESGRLDWPIKYPAGNGKAVAVGDLNCEGRKDIVVSMFNGIGVYYQNSSGTWDPMVLYPSQHSVDMDSIGLKIADMNNDGLLDVVSLYKEAGIIQGLKTYVVEMALQNADGTLRSPKVIQVIQSASDVLAIETGDLNNDGLMDIVVTITQDEESRNGFMVLLQNPDGTFGFPVYYSAPVSTWPVTSIAVGDVNGDGLADVVVTYGSIGVFLQNDQGTLNQVIGYPTNYFIHNVAIADVDNDGRQDVIVLHAGGFNILGFYIQSKDGTLMAEEMFATSSIHFNPQGLAVEDINGDGAKDVIFADISGLGIHYNNGVGPKIHSQSLLDFGSAVIGDPSQKSLIFFNAGGSTLSIQNVTIRGPDAPQFYVTAVYCSGYPVPQRGVCQVEMVFLPKNNGLKNATLSIESNDPKMPIRTVDLKGEGVLSRTPVPPIAFKEVIYQSVDTEFGSVAIGDVNGDGRADLVVSDADGHLFVYLQNAAGQLDSPIRYEFGSGYVRYIAIGDLNKDGRNDVVVSVQRGDLSASYAEIGIFYQNESGQLEPMRSYQTGYNEIWRIKIGDFNNDGLPDIAAMGGTDKHWRFIVLALFFQNREGTFDSPVSYETPYYTFDIQIGDMNRDGLTDIVVFDSENAQIYLQNSRGRLNTPFFRYMQQEWWGGGLAIGDLNGDGIPDVVTTIQTNRPFAAISVALQNSEGTLDPVTWIYPSLDDPNKIVVADVNGDGRQDVIVYHGAFFNAIGIFLQDLDGSLMDEKLFGAVLNDLLDQPLAAGDINGDGADEIVLLHGNTMSIFYHRAPLPKIGVSQPYVVFGTVRVGESSSVTLTISNYGDGDSHLMIGTVPQPAVTDFTKQNDSCSGVTLAYSEQCSVQVRFAPTICGPEPPASFLIPSNDPDTPILSVPLSGEASGGVSPIITSQPKSQAIQCGQTATMVVNVSGSPPFSYQWYRGPVGDISNPLGTNSNTYTTPILTQTTSYWVRVSNSCGHSDSAGATITVTGISVVSPNGGETPTAGSTQTIQWAYAGNVGSRVRIELLKGGTVNRVIKSFTPIGRAGNGSFNWLISSTQATGSDYKIRITSTRYGSYTDTSNTNFTIMGPPPPPANVSASDGTYPDRVEVTWAASSGATSYTVYRATSPRRLARKTSLGTTSGTSFNDTTATPGKTYYYYVKASNTYGTSDFSSYDAGYR